MMAAGVLILGGLQRHGRGQAEGPLPHAVERRLVALHGQCRAEDTCCQSTFNKDSSAEPLGYSPGPKCLSPPSPVLLAALKDEGVGVVPRPSSPSGAECLCHDVRQYKVMKGLIKVTACWSVACSSPTLSQGGMANEESWVMAK